VDFACIKGRKIINLMIENQMSKRESPLTLLKPKHAPGHDGRAAAGGSRLDLKAPLHHETLT
jgi:hypothetical protein